MLGNSFAPLELPRTARAVRPADCAGEAPGTRPRGRPYPAHGTGDGTASRRRLGGDAQRRGRLAAPSREAQGLPLFVAATPEAARARAGRPPRVPRRAGRRGPGPSSPPPGGARGPGGAVVPSGERWPPPRRSGGSPPRPPRLWVTRRQ